MCLLSQQDFEHCRAEPPHKFWEVLKCEIADNLPASEHCGDLRESPFRSASKIICSICHRVQYLSAPPDRPVAEMGWMALDPQPPAQPLQYGAAPPLPHPPPQVVAYEPPPLYNNPQAAFDHGRIRELARVSNLGDNGQIPDEHPDIQAQEAASTQFVEEQGQADAVAIGGEDTTDTERGMVGDDGDSNRHLAENRSSQ